jgi:hypothetical protein
MLLAATMVSLLITAGDSLSNAKYDHLQFRRSGGGNKEFTACIDTVQRQIHIQVTKYSFRDTSYSFNIPSDTNLMLYKVIDDILNGRIDIEGKSKGANRPTGTWVALFAVTREGHLEEIGNSIVRDSLMGLEKIVNRNRL